MAVVRILSMLAMLLVALCAPATAAVGPALPQDQVLEAAQLSPSVPANLPNLCELMGGKRVLPEAPGVATPRPIEVVGATRAQWRRGLADQPMRAPFVPGTELPPPRLS